MITARRSAARSIPGVWPPAAGSTFSSTARAASSDSRAVASQISRARYKSISPDSSAAPVAASRQPRSTASPAHHDAPYRDMVSSSATSATADAGTRSGRPSSPVPMS